jgi:hypothetical protein
MRVRSAAKQRTQDESDKNEKGYEQTDKNEGGWAGRKTINRVAFHKISRV